MSGSRGARREILDRELHAASAIPCQIYPYVVGVFLWDEREEILRRHEDRLSVAPWRAVQKVLEADSYSEFLTSIRWKSRLRHRSGLVTMTELLEDRQRATEIFSEFLHAELEGTIEQSESGFAKQLDMVLHARVDARTDR